MNNTALGFPYPSSSDDPDIPGDMLALAAALNTYLSLPAMAEARVANVITVTATTFANLPSPGPLTLNFTNPSSVYNLECDLQYSAWLAVSASDLRVGVAASGGMTFTPTGFAGGGAGSYANSDNLIQANLGAAAMASSIPLIIPAGAAAITFTLQAMRSSATGSQFVNYPVMRIKPRRYMVP